MLAAMSQQQRVGQLIMVRHQGDRCLELDAERDQ